MINILKDFLFLGATGFGGPLSLIQQMRQHYVDNEKQITAQEFDQAFTLIKAMPGPIAFQMAVYCGQRLKGRVGGLVAGTALLVPAFLMMLAVGIGYEFFSGNKYVLTVLNGFQFAVAAVILFSLKNFFTQNGRKVSFWIYIILAAICFHFRLIPEPLIIVGFGIIAALLFSQWRSTPLMSASIVWLPLSWPQVAELFKICAIAGAVVFGTGLAMFPVLQQQFVVQYHWLDLQTFNDGVSFGQMTPGPVTISATFFGYKIAGVVGALVATAGIFIMPLFHMLTWFPLVLGWLSKQKWIANFLLGATGAVVGVLAVTIYRMNQSFLHLPFFWIIFTATFLYLLWKPRTQILLVILAGGIINLVQVFATLNAV